MTHQVFLIDLASARPTAPPATEQWPALAKEHGNQLTRCIRRIITHSNVESVTTHLFDSAMLTHYGTHNTKRIKDALENLNRIPVQVAKLDTTRMRYPTARGVLAGLTDGVPEDRFSEFYTETDSGRDVYVFTRAPATRAALAEFLGKKELALSSLERGLYDSAYLPKTLKKLAKRGERLIWVNSTPRRCERAGDFDHDVERVFSKWLLSYSREFRFVNLHSYLLDRRIVPVKTIVGSLWDGSVGNDLGLGKPMEVLCLQDSQLLRCFSACINALDKEAAEEDTSQTTLVLSGFVRNYGTEDLTRFGAFDKTPRLVTPAPDHSGDNLRPLNSSVFAGLMVDLARQNMCLIADFFEVNETSGFSRYQTLLQPITPLSAVLRKVSRTETVVNYNSSCLPQSLEEWMSWDKLEGVKDCEITDSAIDASAKFFETYLPDLFSTARRKKNSSQGNDTVKRATKKGVISQNDRMLLSFEGSTVPLSDNVQDETAVFFKGMGSAPKGLKRDRVTGPKVIDRDSIMKQLRAQQDVPDEEKPQVSPKVTPRKQVQKSQKSNRLKQPYSKEHALHATELHASPTATPTKQKLPQDSNRSKEQKKSPTSANKFVWQRRSQVVAPSDSDIHRCIEAHLLDKKGDRSPDALCKNTEKTSTVAVRVSQVVVSSEPAVPVTLSPTTPEDRCHEHLVSDGRPQGNTAPMECREIVADPDALQYNSESDNCSPMPVRKQSTRLVGEDKATQSKNPADGKKEKNPTDGKKENTDMLAVQEADSQKHHPLMKAGERFKSECERNHGRLVREGIQAFSKCLNKLLMEGSNTIEKVIWEGVTLLSSLAKSLSFHHDLQCDMDRIINLNLKIPKAVSNAVQAVQNKLKNDDSSPNVVLCQMWETILSAFEQAMWHLASAQRAAIKASGKKLIRVRVRDVSKILTCTQIMAEMAANSRRQPVPFRTLFSKLFSSVFVHLGLKDSGEPIPYIISLFEAYEQPLPTPLQAAIRKGRANREGDQRTQERTNPCTGGTPAQTQPLLASSSKDRTYPRTDGPHAQTQPLLASSFRNANSSIRPENGLIDDIISSKITKKRNRAAKMAPSALVAQARKSAPKLALARPQFARESEALRNARKSQTRLPLQSTKSGIMNKSRSKGTKREVSKDKPDRPTLREILASTVPAPMIDEHDDYEPDEDTVEQTPPPRIQNEGNNKVIERPSARHMKDKGVEDVTRAGEDKSRPSGSQKQKKGYVKESGKQGDLDRDECEKNGQGFNRQSPAPSRRATRSQTRDVMTGQKPVDEDSAPGSTDEVTPTRASRAKTNENCKNEEPGNEQHNVSISARPVTRSQANQVPAGKMREGKVSMDASPESSRRLTRSQAKQTRRKHSLETSPALKESSPGSSGKRKRRRKEVSMDPKLLNDSSNVCGYESSPISCIPTTRSQIKAAEKKASLQLRNRAVNRPRQLATLKPVTRDVVADIETPSPMKDSDGIPKTPVISPHTPRGDMLSPAPLCPVTPRNVLSPETPIADTANHANSELHRIVHSSLEKRKGELCEEEIIPETPVAPKPAAIIPPCDRSVRRTLRYNE